MTDVEKTILRELVYLRANQAVMLHITRLWVESLHESLVGKSDLQDKFRELLAGVEETVAAEVFTRDLVDPLEAGSIDL